ncbi:MAG: hypothetical protein ACR2NH_00550 [Solirubrobacteraceae bacterium]
MTFRRVLAVAAIALASAAVAPSAQAIGPRTHFSYARYSLANGCYQLRSLALDQAVGKRAGGGYAVGTAGAEPFRMKATRLGAYLFYGPARDYLAANAAGEVVTATTGSPSADWQVDVPRRGVFVISLPAADKVLSVGAGGRLELVSRAAAGAGANFKFSFSRGCAQFPEVEVNAVGTPGRAPASYRETSGLADTHMHMMAFEFLGGKAHCGKPWSPYGVEQALVDCPDHFPNGGGAVLENALSGGGRPTHDPVGWPTFRDWPAPDSLTHEQSYYKWLERSWRGGLRIFVNLLVENKVLCEVYPYKQNSCDEMDSVRLQARRIRELENYIDAQSGGPGKGFFRIVTDPFQARRVANSGKLAVVLGIEVSEPFGCRVYNDVPQCDRARIDRELDEVYGFGVRDMEIVNKFDNALAGVAGDNGPTGVAVNSANKLETGKYWDMRPCTEGPDEADREQVAAPGTQDGLIANGLGALIPGGTAPVYPAGPVCNARGLTDLGEFAIQGLMNRRMIVDPDHLSVVSRKQVMSLLEARGYPGVVSSHSWSTPAAEARVLRLGGVVTPYAGDSTGFVKEWQKWRGMRDPRFYSGLGWGADQNGFGAQGDARKGASNPVTYPFRSFDGKVTLDKQRSGSRVYDINQDGVAHYGLYPDWVEDLRKIAGQGIVDDLARGSEAYLQMWERTVGVPANHCQPASIPVTSRSLGQVRLGIAHSALLMGAGQPAVRGPRVWRYCVAGRAGMPLAAVLSPRGSTALIVSRAPGHRALGVRVGDRVSRLGRRTRSRGLGIYTRPGARGTQFVYGVTRGRVRLVGVASTALSTRALKAYLRLVG